MKKNKLLKIVSSDQLQDDLKTLGSATKIAENIKININGKYQKRWI